MMSALRSQTERWSVALTAALIGLSASPCGAEPPDAVQFNRDVRPILSDHCFACHGPDSQARQADLRLDRRDGLYSQRDDGLVVAPGDADGSLLWRRVSHADPDQRMPPAESPKPLSQSQRRTLRQWIQQGAPWEDHWAFIPPRPQNPPAMAEEAGDWALNPIDAFVLRRLTDRGIEPSPEADYQTLVRRVSLDLTGLPPSQAQLDAALADPSPQGYQRLVDRLLASPAYGEQMAVAWLDAARYADTSGYQNDGPRQMWRWRDWVIESLNADLPFDRFTVEQLAGDLLPGATDRQRLATGFHRNHRGNSEGGIVPEEFAVEYVVDRVDTTATVWLGLTLGCARCHSHKFDPITQEEYYRLYAYFNNIPEHGRAVKEGNSPPYMATPTPSQQRRLSQLHATLEQARDRWVATAPQRRMEQQQWERALLERPLEARDPDWLISRDLALRMPLDGSLEAVDGAEAPDDLAGNPSSTPTAGRPSVRGDTLFYTASPLGKGASLRGRAYIEAGDRGGYTYFDAFSVSAWVRPEAGVSGGIVTRMSDDSYSDGWALHLEQGRVQVNLVRRWLDDALRVELPEPLEGGRWHHVGFTYDGSRRADGVTIYVDGRPREHRVVLDALNQSFLNEQPLRVGSTGTLDRLEADVADVRIYSRAISPAEAAIAACKETLAEIAATPPESRSDGQRWKIEAAYLDDGASQAVTALVDKRRQLQAEIDRLTAEIPSTMVMVERPGKASAVVLERGAYDQPGEAVEPGVPGVLLRDQSPPGDDRLALARWIVSPDNPLTARVAVNRQWQHFFGRGLVETSEDFGTQGAPPTHPELLDYLAREFMRRGWSVKRLQRLIVTSAVYRQSSAARPELEDPDNRLLARGPRQRLTAETVRDQALAAAGLLDRRIGGESVYPYQIDGLWDAIATTTEYRRSTGGDLYRRGVYCYMKRTVSNPSFAAFDAPNREACVVRRSSTNTALQALVLLNDVTFVEAARQLAAGSLAARSAPEERLAWMFRQLTSRRPEARDLSVLREGLHYHRRQFAADPRRAADLLDVGDSPAAEADAVELAALTVMASVLLNLDEVVARP